MTVAGDERHPFQDGDVVQFRELVGLENLNGCEKTVKGKSSTLFDLDLVTCLNIDLNIHQFSIGDISALGGEYKRGGIAREVKQPMTMTFVSPFSVVLLLHYQICSE